MLARLGLAAMDNVVKDSYLGAVIGLVLATKKVLETSPANMECVVANLVLLYVILGTRIGFHWLKFVNLLVVTVLAYSVFLKPSVCLSAMVNVSPKYLVTYLTQILTSNSDRAPPASAPPGPPGFARSRWSP